MRRLAIVLALAASALAGCTCAAERQAVREIRDTHRLILPEYMRYVEKDAALGAAEKDRRKKLAESLDRLADRLEKSLED